MNQKQQVAGLWLMLWILPFGIQAQTAGADLEDRIPDAEKAEGTDVDRLAGIVEQQSDRPDINSAVFETLLQTPCLTRTQAEALISHRSLHGAILCAEELMAIQGFEPSTIQCLVQQTKFPERFTMPDELEDEFAQQLSLEVTGSMRSKSIPGNHADSNEPITNGDALHSALRIRAAGEKGLKAGINLEKDAYEAWWGKGGADHTGWFIQYAPPKDRIRVIAGDYYPDIGQGLLFGRNSFGATGGEATGLIRCGTGLRTHTSMSESGYLKGLGVQYRTQKIELMTFGSYLKTDGRITWSQDSLTRYFTEDRSGYHRTPGESVTSGTGHTGAYGGRIGYHEKGWTTGVTACKIVHELPALPNEEPYAYFRPKEKTATAFSVDYRHTGNRALLFGEWAIDSKGAFSNCTGLLLHPQRNLSAGFLFRHRDRRFIFPFSNPVGYATEGSGETGLSALLGIRFSDRSTLQVSHDSYILSWLGYDRNSLSRGSSETLRLLLTKGKSTEAQLQVRILHSTAGSDGNGRLEETENSTDWQFRAQVIHRPVFGMQYKTRVEIHLKERSDEHAPSLLLFHEVRYRIRQLPLTATIRSSLYKTNGFSEAIYCQESMPLYQFGSAMNYGTGWRNYLMLQLDLSRSLDLWLRFCQTRVFERQLKDEFSGQSGPESIESNVQIRWRFL